MHNHPVAAVGRFILLFVVILFGLGVRISLADEPVGAITVGQLKCNGLIQASISAGDRPMFSWILQSSQSDEKQTAYQVIVEGAWDSGRVESDQSINVIFSGKPIEPCKVYSWRVRVWDSKQHPSDWSQRAIFFTGPQTWSARWIGLDPPGWDAMFASHWIWYPEGNPAQSAPVGTRYFRKTIEVPSDAHIKEATVSGMADNSFSLRINGEDAGSSNTFSRIARLDATTHLHGGSNRIEVAAINAGAGPTPAGFFCTLHIDLGDGHPIDVPSDAHWEASMDKQTWVPAMELGSFGMGPWGLIGVGGRPLPARYLRRNVEISKPIARATAYVCGLGFFNLSVNGQKISDDVMDPALSDYTKACYYKSFDVTPELKQGSNAIGVVLGNGRFFSPRSDAMTAGFGFPKLLFQMQLDYADGTTETVISDGSWKATAEGPIRANNEYDGETYDATMALPGWDQPGFDDHTWSTPALTIAPAGKLYPQDVEPMRVTQILRPVSVTKSEDGTFLADFGQNFYGTIRLTAQAPRGTKVRMTSSYSLKKDGTLKTADNRGAKSTDIYTFAGNGTETWNPQFKGQGFRRVRITGFPGELTAANLEGLVMHTDAEPIGDFQCSNDLINRIHTALRWGSRMFMRSAPLDPDRDERQAWMGDPAKDAESEAYNFNVSCFYRKWMNDVQQSQRPDGSIPDVAMYWQMGDGVEWPAVFTIIPDWFIDFYGDETIARAHYQSMKIWVLAMRRHERPDGTLNATSYGDWCDTYTMGGKISDFGFTPRDLISSAYQYHNYRIMQRLATLTGQTEDQKLFADLGFKLKEAFNRKFLDPQTHIYLGDTQCSYLLPLTFGLVPDDQSDAVANKLVDDILIKHQGHLSVGLVGMQWLMQTLTNIGRPDVAWTIASQTTIPSWGYMLSKGATTIWERWDFESRGPGMNSEALLIQAGNLDAWFYQTLAGINPAAPGFKRILIKPQILGDLTWVKAHFDSPYGRIESNWEKHDHQLIVDVTIPVNTTASIIVPGKDTAAHEVGSGHYRFTVDNAF